MSNSSVSYFTFPGEKRNTVDAKSLAAAAFAALTLATGFSGCAGIRRAPGVRWFFLPNYYRDGRNPRFSCEYPRAWGRPVRIEKGIEMRSPDGLAAYSIAFLQPGDKDYKAPDLYRQYMSSWGAVEDSHIVSQVRISTFTAYRVRFSTYEYDPQYLLGAKHQVYLTEVSMIPDPDGIFVFRYRAGRDWFWKRKYRKHYERFLKTFAVIPLPAEETKQPI